MCPTVSLDILEVAVNLPRNFQQWGLLVKKGQEGFLKFSKLNYRNPHTHTHTHKANNVPTLTQLSVTNANN